MSASLFQMIKSCRWGGGGGFELVLSRLTMLLIVEAWPPWPPSLPPRRRNLPTLVSVEMPHLADLNPTLGEPQWRHVVPWHITAARPARRIAIRNGRVVGHIRLLLEQQPQHQGAVRVVSSFEEGNAAFAEGSHQHRPEAADGWEKATRNRANKWQMDGSFARL